MLYDNNNYRVHRYVIPGVIYFIGFNYSYELHKIYARF